MGHFMMGGWIGMICGLKCIFESGAQNEWLELDLLFLAVFLYRVGPLLLRVKEKMPCHLGIMGLSEILTYGSVHRKTWGPHRSP